MFVKASAYEGRSKEDELKWIFQCFDQLLQQHMNFLGRTCHLVTSLKIPVAKAQLSVDSSQFRNPLSEHPKPTSPPHIGEWQHKLSLHEKTSTIQNE